MSQSLSRRTCAIFLVLLSTIASAGWAATPPRLEVQGTPEQVGRLVGTQWAAQIRRLAPAFVRMAGVALRVPESEVYGRAGELGRRLHADDMVELRGVAEGAEVPLDQVLVVNLFYSLTQTGPLCRQFAAWGDQTPDGELIHARNLDWRDYPGDPLSRHHVILDVAPAEGLSYMSLTWPGFQPILTGSNRAGISVGFNTLAGRPRTDGEPTFFVLKRVLRTCATLDEAVAMIRRSRPMDSGSILISSGTEMRALVVEIVGERIGIRDDGGRSMIGNANHPTAEAGMSGIAGVKAGPADAPVCRVASRLGGPFTLEKTRALMAHQGVLAERNLLNVVFQPSRNRMDLATAPLRAALRPAQTLDLFRSSGSTVDVVSRSPVD